MMDKGHKQQIMDVFTWMANKHMTTSSASSGARNGKQQAIIRYQLTPYQTGKNHYREEHKLAQPLWWKIQEHLVNLKKHIP